MAQFRRVWRYGWGQGLSCRAYPFFQFIHGRKCPFRSLALPSLSVISNCKKVHRSFGPPCALHVPDRVQICRSDHLAVNNSHVVCTFSDSEQSDLKTTLSIVNSYRKRGSAFLSVKFIFNELLCSPLGRQIWPVSTFLTFDLYSGSHELKVVALTYRNFEYSGSAL